MLGEIDKDFYCSAFAPTGGSMCAEVEGNCKACDAYHRKWPTPKQYEQEYKKPVRDDQAVYIQIIRQRVREWRIMEFDKAEKLAEKVSGRDTTVFIVCACTPYGKPPKDWKPELD